MLLATGFGDNEEQLLSLTTSRLEFLRHLSSTEIFFGLGTLGVWNEISRVKEAIRVPLGHKLLECTTLYGDRIGSRYIGYFE